MRYKSTISILPVSCQESIKSKTKNGPQYGQCQTFDHTGK